MSSSCRWLPTSPVSTLGPLDTLSTGATWTLRHKPRLVTLWFPLSLSGSSLPGLWPCLPHCYLPVPAWPLRPISHPYILPGLSPHCHQGTHRPIIFLTNHAFWTWLPEFQAWSSACWVWALGCGAPGIQGTSGGADSCFPQWTEPNDLTVISQKTPGPMPPDNPVWKRQAWQPPSLQRPPSRGQTLALLIPSRGSCQTETRAFWGQGWQLVQAAVCMRFRPHLALRVWPPTRLTCCSLPSEPRKRPAGWPSPKAPAPSRRRPARAPGRSWCCPRG